ncbi:MAG: PKD domain-containing protein, partial [Aggregatilineales bacterium]
ETSLISLPEYSVVHNGTDSQISINGNHVVFVGADTQIYVATITISTADNDEDDIPDNIDPDDDNDDVPDVDDAFPFDPTESSDADEDGIGDNADPDDDNDDVPDVDDAFPFDPTEDSDFDEDGIGDNADPDDDNDNVPDVDDAYPFDPTRTEFDPLLTPTTLTFTIAGSNVNLTWVDNALDENSYRVEHSTDNGATWAEIANLAVNSAAYTDSPVLCEADNQYRVRAYRNSDTSYSGYSNIVTALMPLCAPTGLALSETSSQLTLTWADTSVLATHFTVQRRDSLTSTWADIVQVQPGTETYIDTDAACGITLDYRVRSVDSTGDHASRYSGIQSLNRILCTPTEFIGQVLSVSQIYLSWADDNGNFTGYTLERSDDNGATWDDPVTLAPGYRQYSDTTVTCDTSYLYRLQAFRDVDNNTSPVVSSNLLAVPDCVIAPSNFNAQVVNANAINLTWDYSAVTAATRFNLERQISDGQWQSIELLGDTVRNYSDTGLICNTQYNYRLRAFRPGDSEYSAYTAVAGARTSNCQNSADSIFGLYQDGAWHFVGSIDNFNEGTFSFSYGPSESGWTPLSGDWNNDGQGDIGLYKEGMWVLRHLTATGYEELQFRFGEAGWQGITGDWDGDGVHTPGVYKDGLFRLRNSNSPGAPDIVFRFGDGTPGSVALSGDWSGQGFDTVGLYKNGNWYLTDSHNSVPVRALIYGPQDDSWVPVTGAAIDKDKLGLYRNGTWRMRQSREDSFESVQMFDNIGTGFMPLYFEGTLSELRLLMNFAPYPTTTVTGTPPTWTPSPTATLTPSVTFTHTPTMTPTVGPSPTASPTYTPSLTPSPTPTSTNTQQPTEGPSDTPLPNTSTPTASPTYTPSYTPLPPTTTPVPFSCNALSADFLSFDVHSALVVLENNNGSYSTYLESVVLHWQPNTLAATQPNAYVAFESLEGDVYWLGYEAQTSVNAVSPSPIDSSNPAKGDDLQSDGTPIREEKVIGANNNILWKTTWGNIIGQRISDYMHPSELANTTFYFHNPSQPGIPCAVTVVVPDPPPPATPTQVAPSPTLTPSITPSSTWTSTPFYTATPYDLEFTGDVTSGAAPLTVNFTVQTSGLIGYSYHWDFDDDGTVDSTAGPDVSYTFTTPGTYIPELRAESSDGRSQIDYGDAIVVDP